MLVDAVPVQIEPPARPAAEKLRQARQVGLEDLPIGVLKLRLAGCEPLRGHPEPVAKLRGDGADRIDALAQAAAEEGGSCS